MRLMTALMLALALALAAGGVQASDDVAVRQLMDQARYWEGKGDDARAEQAWRKLLNAVPDHPDARAGVARIERRRGTAPTTDRALLPSAPSALAAGASVLGMPTARDAAAARPRAPRETPAAEAGWSATRASLEARLRANPQDAVLKAELAKHLTYREGTRAEGIRMLAALSQARPDDVALRDAWRQALTWLGNRSQERAMIEAYLQRFPADQALGERLRVPVSAPATGGRGGGSAQRSIAFAALEQGEHEKAESAFRSALAANPRDVDAHGGLGVIYLRREDFIEAALHLDRAIALGGAGRWSSAARSARYWRDVEAARAAQSAGRVAEARSLAEAAVATDPGPPEAAVLLADLWAEEGRAGQAEAAYRQVLQRHPMNEGAFRGLLQVLVAAGRLDEMRVLVRELRDSPAGRSADAQARAVLLLRESEVLAAAGDDAGAAALLEDALVRDPNSRAIRAALARTYQRVGRSEAAMGLLGSSLDANEAWGDGWFTQAQALAGQKRWLEALYAMERIPFGERDDAMAAEQNRFWTHATVDRAVSLVGDGQANEGLALLRDAEARAEGNPGALSAVASAWVDLGQAARGIALARRLLSAGSESDIGLQMTYAGLLLRAGEVDEARLVLEHLSELPLSDAQVADLNGLIRAYTLRHADGLRERGEFAEAFDTLRPLFGTEAPDASLSMALARLYLSAGDPDEALAIALPVLRSEPRSAEHRMFAVGAAMAARDLDDAERHLVEAERLAPGHPRVLTLRGQLANLRGDRAGAREWFERALQAERGGIAAGSAQGLLDLRLVEHRGDALPATAPAAPLRPAPPVRPRVLPLPGGEARRSTQGVSSMTRSLPPTFRRAETERSPSSRALPAAASGIASTRRTSEPPQGSAAAELARLDAAASKKLEAGLELGSRSGESGLGQLDRSSVVVQAHWPLDSGGTLSASLTPVTVDAGPLDVTDPFVATRFGTNALGAFLALPPGQPATRASGTAAAIAYRDEAFAADIGVTPVGFTRSMAVGGLSLLHADGDFRLQGSVERRAVTDSLLSWGSMRDPQSLRSWGGVTRNGLRLFTSLGDEEAGVYAALAGYQLDGRLVARNDAQELGLGGYLRLWNEVDSQATLGIHVETQAYEKNLSHFTFGHGGYFSPQRFLSLSFPFTTSGQRGRLSYQLGADVGARYIRQDAAPYFPNDPLFQSAWAERVRQPGLENFPAQYAASSERGFGLGLRGAFEYRLRPDVAFGGRMHWDNSRDYDRYDLLLYLRFGLGGLPGPFLPLQPLRPIDQGVP